MAYNLEEQEQLDNFKAFWSKWGTTLLVLITTLVVGFVAYYGYQTYQRNQSEKAAPLFEQLEKTANTITQAFEADLKTKLNANLDTEIVPSTAFIADSKNLQLVNDLAKKLIQQYPDTGYAQIAATLAAKVHTDLGKNAEAEYLWQWLVDTAKDPEYSYLARLHLATAMIDAKKSDKALALLIKNAPKEFELLYADRRGDALVDLNKTAEAIAEYQKAWTLAENNLNLRDLIDQKMQTLGAKVIKPVVSSDTTSTALVSPTN
jgi:predicted negative regulator of RcsB-dependent stress response